MITKAKRYLYLTTPYLAIDETITSALCTAARSGVDVRIMTPRIPDKKGGLRRDRVQLPRAVGGGSPHL
ncbi:MAG: phospholipase D-like domain-containing protein [Evtepia gabavorous]